MPPNNECRFCGKPLLKDGSCASIRCNDAEEYEEEYEEEIQQLKAAIAAKDAEIQAITHNLNVLYQRWKEIWGMLKNIEVNLQHPWPGGFEHFAAFYLPKIQYVMNLACREQKDPA